MISKEVFRGRMLRLHPLLALVLLVAAGLSGCGDDVTFRTDRPIVRFELDEYRIAPQDVTVRPGRLKLQVRNVGRATHNLAVQLPQEEEGEEVVEIERTETVRPGEGGEIKVALRPGDYVLICTIANHDDLGQFGELHVLEE